MGDASLSLTNLYSQPKITQPCRIRDFLAMWKDADPEVPVLKEAKVEYAKLQ